VHVNGYQVVAHCVWVGGRLPGEAEWAFAAMGLESMAYPWGESFSEGRDERLNYCDSNCDSVHADFGMDDDYFQAAPVGTYVDGESWVGAYTVMGNVWDWYGFYTGHRWEQHPTFCAVEGGVLWGDTPAARFAVGTRPSSGDSIGFRCVMDAAEAP